MNAIADTRVHAPVAPPHATHKFKLLLKREFWEHKGGFFWAPLVAGAIFLALSIMGIVVGEIAANRVHPGQTVGVNVDGNNVVVNGLNLGKLTAKMSAEDLQQLSGVVDLSLYMAAAWPLMVLTFVVFFYCLGSLYDDRKDRSVLFWKSLPLSDTETVLSKAFSATVMAPTIAVFASIVTMFGFLLVTSVAVMFHGGNPVKLLWGPASPLEVAVNLIASIPVYALWAMPTVGWLMLCSAWARSKPFLWAIMIPVFAGIFVSWFDLMGAFDVADGWFWRNIVARALLSVAPVSWFDVAALGEINVDGPRAITQLINLRSMYSVLATPQLWAGVVAGAAMMVASIRLRRWRDEG